MNIAETSLLLKPGYEIVFTVTEYFDGPVRGIANFQGKPHFYDCQFDKDKDEYSKLYQLTPIEEQSFLLAMEDWEIWLRWQSAFHAGKVDISTHPALPGDRGRHDELAKALNHVLVTDPLRTKDRVGTFEVLGKATLPKGASRPPSGQVGRAVATTLVRSALRCGSG